MSSDEPSTASSDDASENETNSDNETSENESGKEAVNAASTSEEGDDGENESDDDDDSDSEEEEDSTPRTQQRPKRGLNLDSETYAILEEDNFLRRSSRRKAAEDSPSPPPPSKKKKANDSDDSYESSDYEDDSRRRNTRRPKKTAPKAKQPTRKTTRGRDSSAQKVVYKEAESSDEDDYLSDDQTGGAEDTLDTTMPAADEGHYETIERVLKVRDGIPGATGPQTTDYNVEEKGDPNAGADQLPPEKLERQYLIKWVGWAHIHNTWENEATLHSPAVKGQMKLNNFIRKLNEDLMERDAEDFEDYNCEKELNDDLLDQHKLVERIISHKTSRERNKAGDYGTEYFIKWSCLPYAESTWEDEALIRPKFAQKIKEYESRAASKALPLKNNPALFTRRRPKFNKFESMPDFLRNEDNPDLELRDYQLDGLNWLMSAWSKENSCILADEMGLGKTIQSIVFLYSLYHVNDIPGPFLVVVPLSTMTAWQREFEQWAPGFNTVICMGDPESRSYIREYELIDYARPRNLKANVILTTFEVLLKEKAFLSKIDWAVLVVDEAHRLKNNESILFQCLDEFHTAHRLLITGTPLQNSLKELWALMRFIMPQRFPRWSEFEEEHGGGLADDQQRYSTLHKVLLPYLLRRVKKDVEKSLPGKVEHILRVNMTALQKQYYKWILTKNFKELTRGNKCASSSFLNIIMELKKCANHCNLIRRPDFEPHKPQLRLEQLLKASSKLILLDKLLCHLKENGHRVLIFSQMVKMLDILQEYLLLRRFGFQRLDGSMRADLRKQALDHFNAPGSSDFCFLLSTRAGGLGINLATADTVVIFDSDWNPQNDLQAMSRAHRIGQKNLVNIYRFVSMSSVDENIVDRAKRKLVLDHLVIQRMDTTGKTILSKNAKNASAKVPFDKTELNAIIKFGAEELFRENEGEEKEPEVDIDEILNLAEKRECENTDSNTDFLGSFKYTNFDIDEEKDIAMAAATAADQSAAVLGELDKDWTQIIPADKLAQIKDEEEKRIHEEYNLGPRQRTKVQETTVDNDEDADFSSSDDDDRATKRGPYKRKVVFNFTEAEIKRFVRAFKKFAHPMERLETIAQDAELEEHSTAEIKDLCNEALKQMHEANESAKAAAAVAPSLTEDGKKKPDRGPIAKLGTVDMYIRPILKAHHDLEPLHLFMRPQEASNGSETPKHSLPVDLKPQFGWDVEWDVEDDLSLLKGVYTYGLGSWDAIKMDPEFGLAEKIFLKEKVKKPQPKHLQTRIDYLLKLLAKRMGTNDGGKPAVKKKKKVPASAGAAFLSLTSGSAHESTSSKKRAKKASGDRNKDDEPPKKSKKKKDHHHGHHSKKNEAGSAGDKAGEGEAAAAEHRKKKDVKGALRVKILSLSVDVAKYEKLVASREDSAFNECVVIFRPIQKHIKKIGTGEDAARSLSKIGDHITQHVEEMSKNNHGELTPAQIERNSVLWIFVSKFINSDIQEVQAKYRERALAKAREHSQHHHHHHRHPKQVDGEIRHDKHHLGSGLQHSKDRRDRKLNHIAPQYGTPTNRYYNDKRLSAAGGDSYQQYSSPAASGPRDRRNIPLSSQPPQPLMATPAAPPPSFDYQQRHHDSRPRHQHPSTSSSSSRPDHHHQRRFDPAATNSNSIPIGGAKSRSSRWDAPRKSAISTPIVPPPPPPTSHLPSPPPPPLITDGTGLPPNNVFR